MGDGGVDALVSPHRLQFCLTEGEILRLELDDLLLCGRNRPLGLHRDQPDLGLLARIDGLVEFLVAVLAEAVAEHDGIDTANPGRLVHQLDNISIVAGKPEEFRLVLLLQPFPHLDVFLLEVLRMGDKMHEEEIEVIDLELSETGIQISGVGFHGGAVARGFRRDPDVFASHLLDKRGQRLVALSIGVDERRVEIVDTFLEATVQHLVVLGIEHL